MKRDLAAAVILACAAVSPAVEAAETLVPLVHVQGKGLLPARALEVPADSGELSRWDFQQLVNISVKPDFQRRSLLHRLVRPSIRVVVVRAEADGEKREAIFVVGNDGEELSIQRDADGRLVLEATDAKGVRVTPTRPGLLPGKGWIRASDSLHLAILVYEDRGWGRQLFDHLMKAAIQRAGKAAGAFVPELDPAIEGMTLAAAGYFESRSAGRAFEFTLRSPPECGRSPGTCQGMLAPQTLVFALTDEESRTLLRRTTFVDGSLVDGGSGKPLDSVVVDVLVDSDEARALSPQCNGAAFSEPWTDVDLAKECPSEGLTLVRRRPFVRLRDALDAVLANVPAVEERAARILALGDVSATACAGGPTVLSPKNLMCLAARRVLGSAESGRLIAAADGLRRIRESLKVERLPASGEPACRAWEQGLQQIAAAGRIALGTPVLAARCRYQADDFARPLACDADLATVNHDVHAAMTALMARNDACRRHRLCESGVHSGADLSLQIAIDAVCGLPPEADPASMRLDATPVLQYFAGAPQLGHGEAMTAQSVKAVVPALQSLVDPHGELPEPPRWRSLLAAVSARLHVLHDEYQRFRTLADEYALGELQECRRLLGVVREKAGRLDSKGGEIHDRLEALSADLVERSADPFPSLYVARAGHFVPDEQTPRMIRKQRVDLADRLRDLDRDLGALLAAPAPAAPPPVAPAPAAPEAPPPEPGVG